MIWMFKSFAIFAKANLIKLKGAIINGINYEKEFIYFMNYPD